MVLFYSLGQVERILYILESNRKPLHLVLGTSPLSFGSLESPTIWCLYCLGEALLPIFLTHGDQNHLLGMSLATIEVVINESK